MFILVTNHVSFALKNLCKKYIVTIYFNNPTNTPPPQLNSYTTCLVVRSRLSRSNKQPTFPLPQSCLAVCRRACEAPRTATLKLFLFFFLLFFFLLHTLPPFPNNNLHQCHLNPVRLHLGCPSKLQVHLLVMYVKLPSLFPSAPAPKHKYFSQTQNAYVTI